MDAGSDDRDAAREDRETRGDDPRADDPGAQPPEPASAFPPPPEPAPEPAIPASPPPIAPPPPPLLPGPPAAAREPAGIPWEERDRIGFAPALFTTIRLSLFEPRTFFSRLHPRGPLPPPPSGPVGSPILYAILVGVPAALASIFWQFVVMSLGIFTGGDTGEALFSVSTSILAAALSPIVIPIALLITTAVIHVFLLLFGGAKEGYLATFRVLCYASAPELVQLVPFCGIVSGIWWVVITGIGLKVVHGTTYPRAFGAIIMPLLVCCGIVTLLAFMAGVAGLLDVLG